MLKEEKMENKKAKTSGGAIVALCSLVYFVSYFARKDFAAVMAGMISDSIIDKSMGGFIGMGLFIAYGVGQLVSGYLGDRIKPTSLLIFGLATTLICNLLMPIVADAAIWLMIPVWTVNGFAQAMLWPPIVRILADNLDHEKFVTANLLVTTAAHVSTILLYLYVPLCLQYMSWKTVFFTATIITFVVMAIFIASMFFIVFDKRAPKEKRAEEEKKEETEPVSNISGEKKEGFFAIFVRAGVVPIFFAIIMMGFLRDGIESWLPTLYSEAFGRAATESILVSAVLPVFSIISITAIRAAHKSKIFANETRGAAILFGMSVVLAIPLAVLINFEQSALRLICLIIAALICGCMHAVNFLYISCLPGRFAAYGKAASASGFCNACTYIGAAASMYGIAAVAEWMGWSVTVITWIAIAVLGVFFSLLAFRKFTAFMKQGEEK